MKIIFWSDYACPYCYIGEVRLQKAIAELGLGNKVELEPRAFELDPSAPREAGTDTASRLAGKYRMSLQEAQAKIRHISAVGREAGIDFRYGSAIYTNTFDAHRLMKLAVSTKNKEIAARTNELLFAAYFTRNLKLSDPDTLLAVGSEAGLGESGIKEMLATDLFSGEVREDEREAARRGVRGVPYFVFENGLVIPGAISLNDFKHALQSTLASTNAQAGPHQCGPDGCIL